MRRAIIVHCWSGYPEYCWYPAAKSELEAGGFAVAVPAMPETDLPKQALWVPALAAAVGEPDRELFLVGHSIGCATILRYLGSLKEGTGVGGVVLVAGFTEKLAGYPEIDTFFETPFDFAKIRSRAGGRVRRHPLGRRPVRAAPVRRYSEARARRGAHRETRNGALLGPD